MASRERPKLVVVTPENEALLARIVELERRVEALSTLVKALTDRRPVA